MKVLLMGFGSFPGIKTNHTASIVKYMHAHQDEIGLQIHIDLLPVSFARCKTQIERQLTDYAPDLAILVGIKFSSPSVNLEKVALNVIDSTHPDIDGVIVQGKLIVPGGPKAYFSNLDLHPLKECLRRIRIPAVISFHAGTYICNQAYYLTCHFLHKLNASPRALLIHIPRLASQLPPESRKHAITYNSSRKAVRLCLEVLGHELVHE